MNSHALSYKRYWEPTYLQATSISLIAGAVSSFITYPAEFLKTAIQFQATAIGFRGRRRTFSTNLSSATGLQSFQNFETSP
jgi:hypothetical protein